MSKYKLQIHSRLQWYLMRLRGRYDYPKPMWFYPTDGWITDPTEIINAIRLDDEMGVEDVESKSN